MGLDENCNFVASFLSLNHVYRDVCKCAAVDRRQVTRGQEGKDDAVLVRCSLKRCAARPFVALLLLLRGVERNRTEEY
jgi:hypothetical protein